MWLSAGVTSGGLEAWEKHSEKVQGESSSGTPALKLGTRGVSREGFRKEADGSITSSSGLACLPHPPGLTRQSAIPHALE